MDTGRSLAAQLPRAARRCPRPPANNSGFAGDLRVLRPLVTLADGLGALQHTAFRRLERVLGLVRLLVDFAGLGKPALRLVILARRGAVPLALVALLRTVRLLVFGHADLRRFYHVLMQTGRRSPPLRTVAEIDRCWGAELARILTLRSKTMLFSPGKHDTLEARGRPWPNSKYGSKTAPPMSA